MPDDNRISAEITAAVKAQVLTKFSEIRTLLDFLINLSADDKRRTLTIAESRAGMVEVFIQQMTLHPALVPSYVIMAELIRDSKLFSDLRELTGPARELVEGLVDTTHLAASDMLLAFLAFKSNAKEAQRRNVVGADALNALLDPFFARGPRTTTPTNPPGPNP